MNKKLSPFNNEIELGLRALSILQFSYPNSYDLSKLVLLDYLTVHSGDFTSIYKSLHAPTPARKSEVFIRRHLIGEGLELFAKFGLVKPKYSSNGVFYTITDNGEPFLDALAEDYTTMLKDRAEWVVTNFGEYTIDDLKKLINSATESASQEIAFSIELIEGF
jgi:hypothetical protein